MSLPNPPLVYDQRDQAAMRALIERWMTGTHRRGDDIEVSPGRLIIKSPNGTRWSIVVSNAGAISATAI